MTTDLVDRLAVEFHRRGFICGNCQRVLAERFARAFAQRGWPEWYSLKFDPDKHPRGQPENRGQFVRADFGELRFTDDEPLAASGSGSDEAEHHRRVATRMLDEAFSQASHIPPRLIATYREESNLVLAGMGTEALRRWTTNVKAIQCHLSLDALRDALAERFRKLHPNTVAVAIRLSPRNSDFELHLDGGDDTGQIATRYTAEVYAHEFAHVVDVNPKNALLHSVRSYWTDAWQAELVPLEKLISRRGRKEPAEGFAEFGRWAWLYQTAAKHHCPRCWEFWAGEGLV